VAGYLLFAGYECMNPEHIKTNKAYRDWQALLLLLLFYFNKPAGHNSRSIR
jgi:hypothetical protein